ncbi:hypothetical protein Syun_018931 [Stephania yunnanensis]|uniref:Protein kinase domain-containing protein n=1 Tax=Stephania yunnanensis TaxID=152371 RepID=A0AAP0NWU5_9MAGN
MRSSTAFKLLSAVFGVLSISCDSFMPNEVSVLSAFKEAIYDDPFLVLSNWNALDANPCNWTGVWCSPARDRVLTLNISSSSLRGFLAPDLGLLSSLQNLILHNNSLLGTIPKELGLLKSLKVLDLGTNQLSGPIPAEIGSLRNVTKINLQSNGLTGGLPSELGNLSNLVELRLDRNKLQGTIPGNDNSSFTSNINGKYAFRGNATGFCLSSRLQIADFSYNFLFGRIPPCLKYLPRLSFQGNCFYDVNIKQRSPEQCGASPPPAKSHPGATSNHQHAEVASKHHGESKPAWLLALEILTGAIVGLLLLLAVLTAVKKCKGRPPVIIPWKKGSSGKDQMIISIDSEMLNNIKKWSRQELELACEDFSNIIGSSADSLVYKGVLKDGSEIAVISLGIKEELWTGHLEHYFQKEVADLARLSHENTGKLLGFCKESVPFTRMLVFEYASNGTLYEHLHYGEGCQLSWFRRMKIIIGIARGLRYLHTEADPSFTVSEINSSAVYLTDDFTPKLVNFDSWKTVLARSAKNSGSLHNGIPSALEGHHLDVQGNIFAFGVLLLEIITGRLPYCKDKGPLVDWAKEHLDQPEIISYLVDSELKHFRYDDLKVICEVVKLCIQPEATKRPSIQVLCPMLEDGIDTSVAIDLKGTPLAWAELALSS